MDPTKQLMIKVKACQRLVKEASYYVKETEENEATLKKMKEDNKGEHPSDAEGNYGRDPYDIKKFQEVLGESQMMIPESKMRRDKAIESLREYVAQLKAEEAGNDAIWGCEWMTKARE
ncbi:hypothetical protein THAOC_08907, partial [Thalassiosira oceanica]